MPYLRKEHWLSVFALRIQQPSESAFSMSRQLCVDAEPYRLAG